MPRHSSNSIFFNKILERYLCPLTMLNNLRLQILYSTDGMILKKGLDHQLQEIDQLRNKG